MEIKYYPLTRNTYNNFEMSFKNCIKKLNEGDIRFLNIKEAGDFKLNKESIEKIVISFARKIPLRRVLFTRNKDSRALEAIQGQNILLAIFLYSMGKSLGSNTPIIEYSDLEKIDYDKETLTEFLSKNYDLIDTTYTLKEKDKSYHINLDALKEVDFDCINNKRYIHCSEYQFIADSEEDQELMFSIIIDSLYSEY